MSYQLREDIEDSEKGRIATANEQNRRLNFDLWMPDAKSSASENVANARALLAHAVSGGWGGVVRFPPQTYNLNAPLDVVNVLGLEVRGTGLRTKLVFDVAQGADGLTIAHSQQCEVSHMHISFNGQNVARAGVALLRTNAVGARYAPSQNHIHHVTVDCMDKAESAVFIGGVQDANNDFHCVEHCVLQYYTVRGIDLRFVMQSYANEFRGVRMYAGAGALYGVDMSNNVGGTFSWYGGFMSAHQEADFNLGRSYQPITIGGGFHGENSKRFMVVAGIYKQISVRDVRWAGNALHEDNKMIRWNGDGYLSIENSSFGDGNNPTRAGVIELLNTAQGHGLGHVTFEHNRVYSSAAAVFSVDKPLALVGNTKITSEVGNVREPLLA